MNKATDKAAWEKHIKQRHFSKRKKSYLGCPLCSFSCSSQNLSFNHDCRGVEGPVNWKFFCRFWAISFSTLIYILIHLNFYNTEEHLQLAQFLFCLLMFLRKTIIICQVQVNILLVQFLDMLLSIPVLVFFGVLSVYSSLVLNHTFTFLSILTGMLRKPSLRLLLAHFEKHENFNTLQ